MRTGRGQEAMSPTAVVGDVLTGLAEAVEEGAGRVHIHDLKRVVYDGCKGCGASGAYE